MSPPHAHPWALSWAGAAHPAQLLTPRPPGGVAVSRGGAAGAAPQPPRQGVGSRPHRLPALPPLPPAPPPATGGHAGLLQCSVTRSAGPGRGVMTLALRLTGVPAAAAAEAAAAEAAAASPFFFHPPGAGAWAAPAGKLLLAARLAPGRPVTLHTDADCVTAPVAVLARGGLGTRFALRARGVGVGGPAAGWPPPPPTPPPPPSAASPPPSLPPAAWAPLAGVAYQARLRGFMRPRRMAVSLSPPRWWVGDAEGREGKGAAGESPAPPPPPPPPAPPLCLANKAPHWNGALRCWCLNFRGRVKLASVKNFQLVPVAAAVESGGGAAGEGEVAAAAAAPAHRRWWRRTPPPPAPPPPPLPLRGPVIVQFGKVDTDAYILDFDPGSLSAAQAFGVALSMFG